jgi:hypothetical protein
MRHIVLVGAVIASMLLSSCAAMFHGTSQQIAVRSNDPHAELFANEAYIGRGSAVTVFHKRQNYTLSARKAGCSDAIIPASKSFDAITLLGVLIDFGVISVLVIDGAATGAWQQFDQTIYVIDPQCEVRPA